MSSLNGALCLVRVPAGVIMNLARYYHGHKQERDGPYLRRVATYVYLSFVFLGEYQDTGRQVRSVLRCESSQVRGLRLEPPNFGPWRRSLEMVSLASTVVM